MKSPKFPKLPKLPEPSTNFIFFMLGLAILGVCIALKLIYPDTVSVWTIIGILIIACGAIWTVVLTVFGD